jgi:excisionase family DNA binding protein
MRSYEMYQIVKGMVEDVLKEQSNLPKKAELISAPTYLTVEEAARELNMKVSRIRTAIFRKEIPYIKIGSLVRIPKEGLHQHMKKAIFMPNSTLEC